MASRRSTCTLHAVDFVLLLERRSIPMPWRPRQRQECATAIPTDRLSRTSSAYFEFDIRDLTWLVSLLAAVVHMRDTKRLLLFVRLIEAESAPDILSPARG